MKKAILALIIIAVLSSCDIANATVEGITSDNYMEYEKPIADEYGYNKGECDREYLEGEEQLYNEYTDHWNVDKVYDESMVVHEEPQVEEPQAVEVEEPQAVEAKPQATPQKSKAKSDKALAKEWVKAHGGGYKIKKLNTISKGKKGRVKGTKYIVRYPKKVKKGKKVKVYVIMKKGEVYAMVCMGIVKE